MSSITQRLRQEVQHSCGDECRSKGCYTARTIDYNRELYNQQQIAQAEYALSNSTCMCPAYEKIQNLLDEVEDMERELEGGL